MSNFAPAAEAATKIITCVAQSEKELGISEISRIVDLNKNMVFRILNSLESVGWVYCNEQKYGLTLLPFQLSSSALSRMNLNTASLPVLYELLNLTGECTYLGVLHQDKVLYLQHLDGLKDVRVAGRVGGTYDLHCSAPGKVLLAYAEPEFIEEYAGRSHEKRTANTLTKKEMLLSHLETVRAQGYATDCEEFGSGITCVAAPIFDYTGKVVAAIGCSAFTPDGDHDKIISQLQPKVCAAAQKISIRLGAGG